MAGASARQDVSAGANTGASAFAGVTGNKDNKLHEGALRRLRKELADGLKEPVAGVSAGPLDENDLSHWQGKILGPEGSPYEGGIFFVDLIVPRDYPFKPPRMTFVTKVWHPIIATGTGYICPSHLGLTWSPAITLLKVLLVIRNSLAEPDMSCGNNNESARQYETDREQYNQTAKEWTQKYAINAPEPRRK